MKDVKKSKKECDLISEIQKPFFVLAYLNKQGVKMKHSPEKYRATSSNVSLASDCQPFLRTRDTIVAQPQ